jgi:D-serine deaminase-like pyridoxal phosphate-dependent protein
MHGYVVPLAGEDGYSAGGAEVAGWGRIDRGSYVRMVSQEHGVAVCRPELLEALRPGSLLGIIPVHSCLAVDLLDTAQDTEGNPLELGRF